MTGVTVGPRGAATAARWRRLAELADPRRARRRQDAGRGRMGEGAGIGPVAREGAAGQRAHRAHRAHAGRGAQRDDRGQVGPARHPHGGRAAGLRAVETAADLAQRHRWRRSFRPTSPTACAGRSSTPPGATSWRSGAMPRRPGTCWPSRCAWASNPRVADDHDAAAHAAAQAADGRPAGGDRAPRTLDNRDASGAAASSPT